MTQQTKTDFRFMGERVAITYYGRTGCACGCIGDYAVPDPDTLDILIAQKQFYNTHEIRPRAVRNALQRLNDWSVWRGEAVQYWPAKDPDSLNVYSLDYDGRVCTVYTFPGNYDYPPFG